jgi:TfoX/Sxy family transcriptional regulator of competence genes
MAFDEGLRERIRDVLAGGDGIVEKKMFGGVAFMLHGNMAVGIVRDDLMVRVGPEAYADLVSQPHARPMDFTCRKMVGFIYVDPAGFESDEDLARWVQHGVRFATSLPPK